MGVWKPSSSSLCRLSPPRFISARFQANSLRSGPQEERAQLQERLAWHEDRLRRAQEKNWDDGMIEQIAGQLSDTRRELAGVAVTAPPED
jgi:hypothetical protein